MSAIQLNKRERLIDLILHMPDEQIAELAELVERFANDPNWSDESISAEELERRNKLDQAAFDESQGESTRPFVDFVDELKRDHLYP